MSVSPLGNGRFRVESSTGTLTAYAVASRDGTWVFLNGRVYTLHDATDARQRATQHDDSWALSSPMPATVISVAVKEGEQVTKGHVMIALEAMKMELPIKAPRDGRVRAVLCRPGDLVQPGVQLVELE